MGMRLGLSREDAADVAQDALLRFARAYRDGAYVRSRGRLSSWLLAIHRNCLVDLQRARAARPESPLASALAEVADVNQLSVIWEEERERNLLSEAIELLRSQSRSAERSIRAFELHGLRGVTAAEVGKELGMTANDVYVAKHRCLQQLRRIVHELEQAWDDPEASP